MYYTASPTPPADYSRECHKKEWMLLATSNMMQAGGVITRDAVWAKSMSDLYDAISMAAHLGTH